MELTPRPPLLRGRGLRTRGVAWAQRTVFDSHLVSLLSRRRHAVVLGDSHAAVLRAWKPDGWRFDVLSVGGATASGIRNPNSRTEALPQFRDRLSRMRRWQAVMTVLGEVDSGYVIWRRAREQGSTPGEALEQTVDRYVEFLTAEVPTDTQVLVMSAPLPTLPDDSSAWGAVAQQRADVQESQQARTEMTRAFNSALAQRCSEHGWTFVDASAAQLDPRTGLIRDDLVRHGSGDHHLPDQPFREIIAEALASPRPKRAGWGHGT